MKKPGSSLTFFLVFFVFSVVSNLAESPRKVLFVTHSAGFKHPVLPHAAQVAAQVGPQYGIEVTATEDLSQISAENLTNYDALLFYTTGELALDENQKAAFLEFIRSGKALVGVHSATDTFYKWPEYGRMIGGYFDGHPWHEKVRIKVEDQSHPATAHLGASFEITDEIYQYKEFWRQKVQVLMSLDTSSVDMTKAGIKRTDSDFALAWTNTYGKGRIFYTALGHRPEVWDDVRFQKHLFNGIRWATETR